MPSRDFQHLQSCYVSASGHARIFTATRYGKRYMLKCLKPDFLYIPIYRQALNKEFEIGLQLDHPHICRTISMEQVEGLGPTIVMEYIDGVTLQEQIEEKKLSPPMAHQMATQLMDALEYLHSKQIIHRDLKPANIMITHSGHNVKLIDFSLSDSDMFSVLKQPAGTSGYIAPEQLLPGAVPDIKADIYSLGMVLNDMAEATGDKHLLSLARRCANRDINSRPATISSVRNHPSTDRKQLALVVILSMTAVALAILIAFTILRGVDEQTENSDGNRALEYQLWDK